MSRNRTKLKKAELKSIDTNGAIKAGGLLPNIYDYRNAGRFRQQFYSIQSNEKAIDRSSREQVVQLSRTLFAQFPIFNVASEFKANWVVGDRWDLYYTGANSAWADKAISWFNNTWANRCSNRGFTLNTFVRLLSQTVDIDGDCLVLLTKDSNNFPLLQVVTTERIKTDVDNNQVTINNVTYNAQDGVLFDVSGTPCFYSIKVNDKDYQYIDVRNAKLIFNAQFFDKYRGLPALYAGTLYGLNLQELDNYTMEALKLESLVAVQETTDNGEGDPEFAALLQQASNDSVIPAGNITGNAANGLELMNGATNRYLKAGNTMTSFRSQRPAEELQSYMTKVETSLLTAIGYPHQLLYSPDKISGRAVDAIVEFVRKSVRARQQLLYRNVKLFAAWAISVAIKNGYLPPNDVENIFEVIEFNMPEEYTLSRRNDRESDNEDYKIGKLTLRQVIENSGGDYEKTITDRKTETITLLQQVEDLSKTFPEVSKEIILNLLSQRGNSTLSVASTTNSPEE